ncbi:MAG: sugar phosphate isomerase/epimerase [Proteiniphilum sp.]|uniref:sugar phosphate isomerase/epimerase family protein n=1 Tax=Proteiniphilum sp. TaxID=1926877 RepID=UPI002B1F1074|nr:sugar phosphate isomerase/epimerase [Proteiniphilum sp.]MEA5128070.1 sugar phosphate isomerase/epimerase [Proteiniphilum sp.]
MQNRRNFIKNASLISLGGILAGKSDLANAAALSKFSVDTGKKIGLQIYSLGKELYENVPGGLRRIGQMGYSTLELAGYRDGKINNIEMAEFRKMAEDAGLKIVSSHLNPPVREYTASNKGEIADFWKKAADDHAKIGVSYIVQPGQPSTRSTEEVSLVCEVFNEAGRIAKENGLIFGYHNHDMEFSRVIPGGKEMVFGRRAFGRDMPKGTEMIYDGFLRQTDPALVIFELDVYWAVMGQNDPLEYMKKYPDRIQLLHIKDREVLGQSGMMNFEQIFNQAYKNGVKDYFVELERVSSGTQFEGVKGCADYLLKAPFVK